MQHSTPESIAPVMVPVPQDHALSGRAISIPSRTPCGVISIAPVSIQIPGRTATLQMRISAPVSGDNLPVILLSHGHGGSNHLSSMNGYSPLVDFWAAQGFVVIQPTHLSSKSLGLDATAPGAPLFWRSRVQDMHDILDALDPIEASVPAIRGRLDKAKISVAGHSMGGHTASMLLGARLIDESGSEVDLVEPRIKAGLLLAPPGSGGADLSAMAYERFAFFRHPEFATMATPALVVVGDKDVSPHLTVRGADWHADPYLLGSGPKCLLTLAGGEHLLGGVSGYDAGETTDENVERVAIVQRMTAAYLRSALEPDDHAWSAACAAMRTLSDLGSVECR